MRGGPKCRKAQGRVLKLSSSDSNSTAPDAAAACTPTPPKRRKFAAYVPRTLEKRIEDLEREVARAEEDIKDLRFEIRDHVWRAKILAQVTDDTPPDEDDP